jgi:hypothetical protein
LLLKKEEDLHPMIHGTKTITRAMMSYKPPFFLRGWIVVKNAYRG